MVALCWQWQAVLPAPQCHAANIVSALHSRRVLAPVSCSLADMRGGRLAAGSSPDAGESPLSKRRLTHPLSPTQWLSGM